MHQQLTPAAAARGAHLPSGSPVLSGGMYTTAAATAAETARDQLSVLLRMPCRLGGHRRCLLRRDSDAACWRPVHCAPQCVVCGAVEKGQQRTLVPKRAYPARLGVPTAGSRRHLVEQRLLARLADQEVGPAGHHDRQEVGRLRHGQHVALLGQVGPVLRVESKVRWGGVGWGAALGRDELP